MVIISGRWVHLHKTLDLVLGHADTLQKAVHGSLETTISIITKTRVLRLTVYNRSSVKILETVRTVR